MKKRFLCFLGLLFIAVLPAMATVLNDGTTAANLTRFSNVNGVFGAGAQLTPNSGLLVAEQTDEVLTIPLRNVWYGNQNPTSGVYTVTADFKPEGTFPELRGGVAGWLNLTSSNGVVFYVTPSGPDASFRVAYVNFAAETIEGSETNAHLFTLDGMLIDGSTNSSASDLAGYMPDQFATFQLDFSMPDPTNQVALSNVTARVTAKVFQGTGTNGQPAQVGQTIALLTDLPVPAGANHQAGYFAYWGSIFGFGTIGELDNLDVTPVGGGGPVEPPTLSITRDDGFVTITWPPEVSGFTLQGSFDFVSWTDIAPTGPNTAHLPTAQAYQFYRLIYNGPITSTPKLSIQLANGSVTVTWPADVTGFTLQSTTDLSTGVWNDVTLSGPNTATLPATGPAMFFRLFQP